MLSSKVGNAIIDTIQKDIGNPNTPFHKSLEKQRAWTNDDWIIDTERTIKGVNERIAECSKNGNASALNQWKNVLKIFEQRFEDLYKEFKDTPSKE